MGQGGGPWPPKVPAKVLPRVMGSLRVIHLSLFHPSHLTLCHPVGISRVPEGRRVLPAPAHALTSAGVILSPRSISSCKRA